MNNSFLLVDCQNDFCHLKGSLYVPGAYRSNLRLAEFIEKNFNKIGRIYVSLDTHSPKHISFAKNWEDKDGNNPKPFTKVSKYEKFVYKYDSPKVFYDEVDVWPVHCVEHSWGAALTREVSELLPWHDNVFYGQKGKNKQLEEYSAVESLLSYMRKGERLIVGGQASNICVYQTVCSLIYRGFYTAKDFVILKDCMNPVLNYHAKQENFFKMITDGGGLVIKSTDYSI